MAGGRQAGSRWNSPSAAGCHCLQGENWLAMKVFAGILGENNWILLDIAISMTQNIEHVIEFPCFPLMVLEMSSH